MKDAEISLRVARIVSPEFEWTYCSNPSNAAVRFHATTGERIVFDYRTDDALGRMAKWFFYHADDAFPERRNCCVFENAMVSPDPHGALADAIIEIGDE